MQKRLECGERDLRIHGHLLLACQELRGKQREIDRLYRKLAAASPLTDAEMRHALAEALARLAKLEK